MSAATEAWEDCERWVTTAYHSLQRRDLDAAARQLHEAVVCADRAAAEGDTA